MWLIFIAYLLLRRYGGPGSEKLAAAVALFGMANVPFVYWSVNVWRTVHPKTSVVTDAAGAACGAFWFCVAAFMVLFVLLLHRPGASRDAAGRAREPVPDGRGLTPAR